MKKIVIVLTIVLAFSFQSNAQDKKELHNAEVLKQEMLKKQNPEISAKNDAVELSKFLELNDTQTNNFFILFESKYRNLQNDLSVERKTELSRVMEAKIRASLDEKSMMKLEKNETLFKKLIN